jgi:2-haloacid dehalogenase
MTNVVKDFSSIRVVTFDCYGTLIDWETGILGAIRPVLDAHGAQLPDSEILTIYGEVEAEAESGEFSPYREVLREVVRGFGERLGFQVSAAEQDSLPNSLATWRPFPDTVAALRDLHTKFQLGIISNVDDDLFAATTPQLQINFDFVVTAGRARAYKPSQKIFRWAQERIGVPNAQWLHAGQSLYHDVVPAKALGITTAWVNRASARPGAGATKWASATPDLEVASLQELVERLADAPLVG